MEERMMSKGILTAVLCSVLLYCAAAAQWCALDSSLEGSEPTVTVLESNAQHTVLAIQVPGFYLTETSLPGSSGHEISIPGATSIQQVGAPKVPRLVYQVGIPDRASVELLELTRSTVTYAGVTVAAYPATDKAPAVELSRDQDEGVSPRLFPRDEVSVAGPVVWRDVRLVEVSVYPVLVNPAEREIEVASNLTVELRYREVSQGDSFASGRNGVSPRYERLYERTLVNYPWLKLNRGSYHENGLKYLMIVDDSLVAAVQPLASWWTDAGLKTKVVATSIAGSTPSEIKATINDYYTNEGIEYVLLVGEPTQIPLWSFSRSAGEDSRHRIVGDHDYACLRGNDYYPEVALGRISTDSADTLTHIVKKILNYLVDPPADGWLEKSMLCAHEENYPSSFTACKNAIRDFAYSIQTPLFETYYPLEGATYTQVFAAMVQGRGIINYRGHDNGSQWSWEPGWTLEDIYQLNNCARTPVVFNITGFSGVIDSAYECLSEAWLNAGAHGLHGAVANLGATRYTSEPENDAFDKILYRALFDEGITRIGDVFNRGKASMVGMGADGIYNTRIYILFGDPAMDVSTVNLRTLEVNHRSTASLGESEFEVVVSHHSSPVEGALVCLRKDMEVYEVGTTNSQGYASLPMMLARQGTMGLTITAHNFYPYQQDIAVEASDCAAMLLDRIRYNCDQEVVITVWDNDLNLNPGIPDIGCVSISSDSEPTPEVVQVVETGCDTGQFTGSILTSATQAGPGFLLLAHGDGLWARYQDAACDGAPREVVDSAAGDCCGPLIANLTAYPIEAKTLSLSWTTDELSDTTVIWGAAVPPSTIEHRGGMVTEHEIRVSGLDPCTVYYYLVASTDRYGNVTIDDNGGTYYQVKTLQLVTFLQATMDADPGWTNSRAWAWGQPVGRMGDPTSGYTGSNVVGYNLHGSYSNVSPARYTTTQPIDCSSATNVYLSFYRWLGVGESRLNDAAIEISPDGGASWSPVWSHFGDAVQPTEWSLVNYDLTPWAARQSEVLVRWGLGPNGAALNRCGWNIDDVTITCGLPCDAPVLMYESHFIDDSAGNHDGKINHGETIHLGITLTNHGLAATGVTATLQTTSPSVVILEDTVAFPNLQEGESGESLTDFVFSISDSSEDGSVIPFTISWTSNEQQGATHFREKIVGPHFAFVSYFVADALTGDNDGVLDPGETASIIVTLRNTGAGAARGISSELASDQPEFITIQNASADFPDAAPGETVASQAPYFVVTASAAAPEQVRLVLKISAVGYYTTIEYSTDVTALTLTRRFGWSMDANPNWTCDGEWAWGQPTGSAGDPTSGYTGVNVYGYNLDGPFFSIPQERCLTSHALDCSAFSNTEIRFQRWLGINDFYWNRACFQVSTDGATWQNIWCHTGFAAVDTCWHPMVYDISEYADGQPTVYLRWTLNTTSNPGGAGNFSGWNLDDIELWAESTGNPPPTCPLSPISNTAFTLE